jgi:hypothetical protein
LTVASVRHAADEAAMKSAAPVLLLLVTTVAGATEAIRTGRYIATFTERSPLSSWTVFIERMGTLYHLTKDTAEPRDATYDLTQEPFELYVPRSYDGSVPYGLIAYVNSGEGGGPPGTYAEICDRHKLIWVGGTRLHNQRPTWSRMRLTIDGVHNVRARYRIDSERIYGMGQSGGGRVTSLMAVPYADVFSGGAIYLIGCDPFLLPADRTVAARLDALAKTRRFAFVTGSDDYNRPGTIEVHTVYQGLRFPHLAYLEEPGLAHATPSAAWFEKAVVSNDAPVAATAMANLAQGRELEAKREHREAYASYQVATTCAIPGEALSEALAAVARLTPVIDSEASSELAKLAGKPQGAAVRAFVRTWPAELPTVARARELADRIGGEELDRLGAKPGVGALRGFLMAWEGYPVCGRALTALDLLAREAWPKTEAVKPGPGRWKALTKFIDDWAPTETARLAAKTCADEIAAKVAEAEALPSDGARAQRLKLLYAETRGTPANAAVQAALIAVALRLQEAKP